MGRDRPGLVLLFLVGLAVLLAMCANPVQSDQWNSEFQYNGQTYEWSEEYVEDDWLDIVGGNRYETNHPPDGNVGDKGQAWCKDLTGEDGWFLPNLDEALAGRNNYVGDDPLGMSPPDMCGPIVCAAEIPQLWTSTTCGDSSWQRRAYALHDKDINVIDDNAEDIAECHNNGDQEHWCCWEKIGYYGHHWCPMARCVRIVGDDPTPTVDPPPPLEPTATPTATPEPTPTPDQPQPPGPEPTPRDMDWRLYLPMIMEG